jgi:hypothetical protein
MQVAAQGRTAARIEGASRALGVAEKGYVLRPRALTVVDSPWLCSIVKTLVWTGRKAGPSRRPLSHDVIVHVEALAR